MITIFNIAYADEGRYSCSYNCEQDHIISGVSVPMQLKVLSGMNNCVIISSAFSKGVRVGEIFRYKEEGGKKINAEKCKLMTVEICNLSLSSVCRLQEIFLFILSHYFAKKRSCNVQFQKISISLTEGNQGLIDFAGIIFGIIRHYEHNFQCMCNVPTPIQWQPWTAALPLLGLIRVIVLRMCKVLAIPQSRSQSPRVTLVQRNKSNTRLAIPRSWYVCLSAYIGVKCFFFHILCDSI